MRLVDKRTVFVYVAQSALAGAYILIAFILLHYLHTELVIASLGASAFIAFRSPTEPSSAPRVMIGGYCVGVVSGLLCAGLIVLLHNALPFPGYILACAVSVFLSMLLMTALRLEHPPSAALSVAIAIAANPVISGLAGLGCILLLCVAKELLKKRLRNL